MLDHTVSALTQCRFVGNKMGRKIESLLFHRIETLGLKAKDTRFLDEFSTGGTLRPAPAK